MGTIIDTAGSAYRKAGARMFFNSDGQQLGLLSGGCLESDLLRQARMVMHSGRSKTVTYDMQDEDDIAWQLGIGCGGKVVIQLDQINAENQYLGLGKVYQVLQQGHSRWHWLWLKGPASTGLEQANENSHNTAGLTPADVACPERSGQHNGWCRRPGQCATGIANSAWSKLKCQEFPCVSIPKGIGLT